MVEVKRRRVRRVQPTPTTPGPEAQVRLVIEGVRPQIDCGRYPVKAVVGDRVEVGADIWKDGHDLLRAALLVRPLGRDEPRRVAGDPAASYDLAGWREVAMETSFETNDRWTAAFTPDRAGAWVYTVLAWTDAYASWCQELRKKVAAKQEVSSELLEGAALVARYRAAAAQRRARALGKELAALEADWQAAPDEPRRVALALSERVTALMAQADPRADARFYPAALPLWVDRERARAGAWYEIFVRSQSAVPGHHGTFADAERRLPAIAAMGFDVLYLTPIHPIGVTCRKGPNNTEGGTAADPGCPWAIGGAAGGHDALHPDLGSFDDFERFRAAAEALGIELALDFAAQCSPDHPWVKQHPEWFRHRPDGTIKYAENPPKKYQDIYPLDFDTPDRAGLYQALLDVARFWIARGVKILRVDNPHTKPIGFWEWFIEEIHRDHPEVIFLAEAFTRPKRMRLLAKLGFTQSYSYFTWRNTRPELEEYCRELFTPPVAEYMRPNFFANTPDILHAILQQGGRPAFMSRLVLAATLSPSYGIYSGFELCENQAVRPGSEEYLDSEKYQLVCRDWQRPGHIIPLISRVNRLRREHPALRLATNLRFVESSDPHLIAYVKIAPGGPRGPRDALLVVVNLDPHAVHEGMVQVPAELRPSGETPYPVTDLLTDATYTWRGEWGYVKLDPAQLPAHVLWL